MCGAPISAGEVAWTVADADWERLQVEAARCFAANDLIGAADGWAAALRTARAEFEADDPRLATSLASQALALRLRGERGADRLFATALEVWDAAPRWLARQAFARRARSSIFHLRLEAKHAGAYGANLRHRAETLLRAAHAATGLLAAGAPGQAPARFEAFRSAPRDAKRKVLAAVHLLPAPPDDARLQPVQDGS